MGGKGELERNDRGCFGGEQRGRDMVKNARRSEEQRDVKKKKDERSVEDEHKERMNEDET